VGQKKFPNGINANVLELLERTKQDHDKMGSTLVEQTRAFFEDIERLERVITDEMKNKPKSVRVESVVAVFFRQLNNSQVCTNWRLDSSCQLINLNFLGGIHIVCGLYLLLCFCWCIL
jgi:hypothetical protein